MSLSIKKNLSNIHTFNFPKKTGGTPNFPKKMGVVDINSLAILKEERIAFISTPSVVYYCTVETEERVNVDELEVLVGVNKSLRVYSSIDAVRTVNNTDENYKEIVLAVTTKLGNPVSDSNPSQIIFCILRCTESNVISILDRKNFDASTTALFVRGIRNEESIYFIVYTVNNYELSLYSVSGSGRNTKISEVKKKVSTIFPEILRRDKINQKTIRFQQFQQEGRRFHIQGTLDGRVKFTLFDTKTKEIKLVDERNFDSPIGDLSLFQISRGNVGLVHPLVANINKMIMKNSENSGNSSERIGGRSDFPYLRTVNLVVGESIGRVFVFWDVEKNGLKKYSLIHDSQDSVLCVYPFDVSGNGLREILVGTYSQKMVILKFDEHESFKFEHADTYHFSSPILALGSLDFTDDSTEELVICLKNSFTIFQQKIYLLQEMLHRKYEKFLKLHEYYVSKFKKDDDESDVV